MKMLSDFTNSYEIMKKKKKKKKKEKRKEMTN